MNTNLTDLAKFTTTQMLNFFPENVLEQVMKTEENFAHADGGLAPRSALARPSSRPPINMSGHFPANVSAESPSNISPNPSEVISEVSET